LQTTQVAEHLLQKLSRLIQAGELPAGITDRIQNEMRWSSLSLQDRHQYLVGLQQFTDQDFRHLVEYVTEASREGTLEQVSAAAQHYLVCLEATEAESRTMAMARVPELIRILTGMHSLEFVRQVGDRLRQQLSTTDSQLHGAVAGCLAAAAQSLAMFEDFESALKIGSELERSLASNPTNHAECCHQALYNLLNATTIQRLLEMSFQKRIDVKFSRMIASLLRMVEVQAAEIVFRMLEEERSASGRVRLLHIARQLGDGAYRAAFKRLEDERWYVVRNACNVLGALDDPELPSHLGRTLRHSDARVQEAAVAAILRSNVAGRGAILVNALPSLPPHLQETVLDELLLLKDSTAIGPLEAFLLNGASTARVGILEKGLRALTALPDEEALQVLGNIALHSEIPQAVRRNAVLALKRSTHPAAQQSLNRFRTMAPADPLAKE
jgi:hypothetical protein